MKTNFLLFSLVSLSLTVLSARATSPTEENPPVKLPAYIVEASRRSPAEKEIKRNLDELRAIAAKPVVVKMALPLPEVKEAADEAKSKSSTKTTVVAGL